MNSRHSKYSSQVLRRQVQSIKTRNFRLMPAACDLFNFMNFRHSMNSKYSSQVLRRQVQSIKTKNFRLMPATCGLFNFKYSRHFMNFCHLNSSKALPA